MKARFFLFCEELRIIRQFYFRSLRFFLWDRSLSLLYFFSNPYRMCRKYFQKTNESSLFCYGETPLSLWERLAKRAQLSEDDCFVDLGCGRGRICFWTKAFFHCRVIGIDGVGSFVKRAAWLSRFWRIMGIDFIHQRILKADLRNATVVYLYTYHDEEEIIDWSQLRPGSKVITVSEPLSIQNFTHISAFTEEFPWGKADVYINQKL